MSLYKKYYSVLYFYDFVPNEWLQISYSEVPNNSIGQNNGIVWTNLQKLIIV